MSMLKATYGHMTVNYKIEQYCRCHLRTYLTVDFSLVITDICPCTEFVNYVRSAIITQATGQAMYSFQLEKFKGFFYRFYFFVRQITSAFLQFLSKTL